MSEEKELNFYLVYLTDKLKVAVVADNAIDVGKWALTKSHEPRIHKMSPAEIKKWKKTTIYLDEVLHNNLNRRR